jgi:GT2 family glycosyltransferase
MNNTLAIIVPNRNGGDGLITSLESILDSVPPATEIWLVDDGSTDDSPRKVRSLFPQVRVLALGQSHGAAYARNKGLQSAKCDLLFCIDADVVCQPGCLPKLVENLQMQDVVFPSLVSPEGVLLHPRGEFTRRCCLNSAIFGIRRPALNRMDELFDETIEIYGEDNDFFLRAYRLGLLIHYVPEAIAVHPTRQLLGERHYYLTVRNAIYVWLKLRHLVSYWMPIDIWIGLFLGAQLLVAILNRGVGTGQRISELRYINGSRVSLLHKYGQALIWNLRQRSNTLAKRHAFEVFLKNANPDF